MINKVNESAVMDLYMDIMKKRLIKKASTASSLYDAVTSGVKTLSDALLSYGKNIDEYIQELSVAGKNVDEIAQHVGKSADEVSLIIKGVDNINPDILKQFKDEFFKLRGATSTSRQYLPSNINAQTDKQLLNTYNNILAVKDNLLERINSCKLMISNYSSSPNISVEDITKLKQQIISSQGLLDKMNESNDEIAMILLSKGYTKELDGKLIPPLNNPIPKATAPIDDVSALKPSSDIPPKPKDNIPPSSNNTKPKSTAIPPKPKLTPKNIKDLDDTEAELDAIDELATENGIELEDFGPMKRAVSNVRGPKTEEELVEQGIVKEKAKIKIQQQMEKERDKGSVLLAAFKNAKKSLKEKLGTGLSDFIYSTLLVGGLKYTLTAVTFVAVGYGIYSLYQSYFGSAENSEQIKDIETNLKKASYDFITQLKSLQFRDGSNGQNLNNQLIEHSITAYKLMPLSELKTEQQYNNALTALDTLEQHVNNYIKNSSSIRNDLISDEGFDNVLDSLHMLVDALNKQKQIILNMQANNKNNERGIEQPIGREVSPTDNIDPTHVPLNINVLGTQIDISRLSPQLRSAAPRIVEKVLKSPQGLVFLDPDNIWGGWLPKSNTTSETNEVIPDKSKNYLEAIKYLYLNKIFSSNDLSKFFRHNIPRENRKRFSGFKNALKYYRNNKKSAQIIEKNNFFTQKYLKSANSDQLSVINEELTYTKMNKKADKTSREFIKSMLKEVSDQYTQSYYDGMKKQFEVKPKKRKSDYHKLYGASTKETMIEKAHPLSVNLFYNSGNGGLIENQVEQHNATKNMLQDMPTGNFQNRLASIVENLVKLANDADSEGLVDASSLIDETLLELDSLS